MVGTDTSATDWPDQQMSLASSGLLSRRILSLESWTHRYLLNNELHPKHQNLLFLGAHRTAPRQIPALDQVGSNVSHPLETFVKEQQLSHKTVVVSSSAGEVGVHLLYRFW